MFAEAARGGGSRFVLASAVAGASTCQTAADEFSIPARARTPGRPTSTASVTEREWQGAARVHWD